MELRAGVFVIHRSSAPKSLAVAPMYLQQSYQNVTLQVTVEYARVYPPGGIVFLASLLSGGVLEKNGGNPLVEMTGTPLKKSPTEGGVISVPILVLSS